MNRHFFVMISIGFATLFSFSASAKSPVMYEYTCSQGMYFVGLNPQFGNGHVSYIVGENTLDDASLTYGGRNQLGQRVYRGQGTRASYQVVFNGSMVSLYQEDIVPPYWLASINCKR